MADRDEAGERILAKAEADPQADSSLSTSQIAGVEEVHREHSDRVNKAQDAVKSADGVRAAEQYKRLLRTVQSPPASKALPAIVQKDLVDNGCGGKPPTYPREEFAPLAEAGPRCVGGAHRHLLIRKPSLAPPAPSPSRSDLAAIQRNPAKKQNPERPETLAPETTPKPRSRSAG